MRRILVFLILATCLAACLPSSPGSIPATTTPEVFNPIPADARAFEAARADLAQSLGIDPLTISRVDVLPVDWPDSCLGLEKPGEACAQMVTPGFRVRLETGGLEYEYHTNQDASSIRRAN
jgi:hypothetical protein